MRAFLSIAAQYSYIPILLFAAILQVTVMTDFQVSDGRADLVLTLVLAWTLLAGSGQGVIWALVAGLAQDLVTGVPLGVSALALAIVMFVVGRLIGTLDRVALLTAPLIAAFGTLGYHLILIGLYLVTRRPISIGYSLLHATLPGMILNALLTIPIVIILARIRYVTRPRRVSSLIVK